MLSTSSTLLRSSFKRPLARLHSIHHPRFSQAANFSRLSRTAPPSQIIQHLKDDGCVVIKQLFTRAQMARLNADMDAILSKTTPGKPSAVVEGSTIPTDKKIQDYIFGSNTKRVDKLALHSSTWRDELVDDDAMHGICAEALKATGDYWLSSAQMIELGPGSRAQPLHPDGGQWWLMLGMDAASAPEFMVNFLIATTRTTRENGATGVLRGSHRRDMGELLRNEKAEIWKTPDEDVETVELDVGDCLLLGSRVWHRGGANATVDERRRVLSVFVTSGMLTPEEAHPFYIDEMAAKGFSERVKKFLGYKALIPSIGAGFWRS